MSRVPIHSGNVYMPHVFRHVSLLWPEEDLGAYGSGAAANDDVDAWVAEHYRPPAEYIIDGICPGRRKDGTPVIVVRLRPEVLAKGGRPAKPAPCPRCGVECESTVAARRHCLVSPERRAEVARFAAAARWRR
jgi:hypothetical protein